MKDVTVIKNPELNQVKINVGYQVTKSTGPFEFNKPYYGIEKTFNGLMSDDQIYLTAESMTKIILNLISKHECNNLFEEIKDKKKNLRLETVVNGKTLVHVTDFLGFFEDFGPINSQPEILNQYGDRGTATHLLFQSYAENGEFKPDAVSVDLMEKLRDGSKQFIFDIPKIKQGIKGIFENHLSGWKFLEFEKKVHNLQYSYCGTLDCIVEVNDYEIKDSNGKKTKVSGKYIADVKTCGSRDVFVEQEACYFMSDEMRNEDINGVITIPINLKNKCFYGAPVFNHIDEIEYHFTRAMGKREEFKNIFSI